MGQAGGQGKAGASADIVRSAGRAFERDRYLAALLAPAGVRDDLLALAAFAGEIARIPGDVSQPLIGEIRLQWWRDALDAAVGPGAQATGHPIADAFAAALLAHAVPIEIIHRVLDAQALRLDDRPFGDIDQLVAHLAAFDGGLFEAAWRMLGGRGPAPATLTQAGVVYGLSRCLIEAPAELAQARIVLPAALIEARDLMGAASADDQSREAARAAWHTIHSRVAGAVEDRLIQLAQSYQAADGLVRLAALPVALVRPYLRVSKRGDIASLRAFEPAPLTRVWLIWRTRRTGRV